MHVETIAGFVHFCLGQLRKRGRRKVTPVHKSNAVPNIGALWWDVFRRELEAFPELIDSEEYVAATSYAIRRRTKAS